MRQWHCAHAASASQGTGLLCSGSQVGLNYRIGQGRETIVIPSEAPAGCEVEGSVVLSERSLDSGGSPAVARDDAPWIRAGIDRRLASLP